MLSTYREFRDLLEKNFIKIGNSYLNDTFKGFSFHFITHDQQDIFKIPIKDDQFETIIDEYIESESKNNYFSDFYIICISNNLIIIERSQVSQFIQIISKLTSSTIYFTTDEIEKKVCKLIDTNQIQTQFIFKPASENNGLFHKSVTSLIAEFNLKISQSISKRAARIQSFWSTINRSISYFLIAKSFRISKIDRFLHYKEFFEGDNKMSIKQEECINLCFLEMGSLAYIYLIYHFPSEKIFLKKQSYADNESNKSQQLEELNYLNINHPLFPRFYCKLNNSKNDTLILEYIEGKTLQNIDDLNLSLEDKIKIIFQLMIVIEYLHYNGFIYRDLKPDNVIIDKNKTAFLIDFNKMIKESDSKTFSLASNYAAPELYYGKFYTKKVDIFSIGLIIEYIFQKEKIMNDTKIIKIINECTNQEPDKRPTISQLIDDFYSNFFFKISPIPIFDTIRNVKNIHSEKFFPFWFLFSEYQNHEAQYQLGQIFRKGKLMPKDMNKAIHFYILSALSKNSKAQTQLGKYHYYTSKDMQKALHYLTLAANQNNPKAQHQLGMIYLSTKDFPQNKNIAIYYLTQSANQKYDKALNNLGILYIFDDSIKDINRGIYYLKISAEQNNSLASQTCLGSIYSNEALYPVDINQAIYYYSLAAERNHIPALFSLGKIFYEGLYIERNINKALKYLTPAADRNEPNSQMLLYRIYSRGEYIKQDYQKAFHYLKLAADNINCSNPEPYYQLGLIYSDERYGHYDAEKAIYYLTLAAEKNYPNSQFYLGIFLFNLGNVNKALYYLILSANQNDSNAQYALGYIFYNSENALKDINKAINYFSLAAQKNNINAIYFLGKIYYENDPKDINKAIQYLTYAAKNGISGANQILGKIYYDDNTKRDINKAIYYLTLAAKSNNPISQYNLAIVYYDAIYVPRDINKAIYYFTLSADQDFAPSQTRLGIIYSDEKYIKPDANKALHYFKLAEKQNDSNAIFKLGLLYYEGKLVPIDKYKAIDYLTKAAKMNNQSAQLLLGNFYFDIFDFKKSIYYLTLSANQSNYFAQNLLGFIYLFIDYVKDINKSIYYFKLAAEHNFYESNFFLGNIYCEGKLVLRNYEKAIEYYKNASSFNDDKSKNNLGVIYKNIVKNIGFAKVLFEEAIIKRNKLAFYNLAHLYFYDDESDDHIDKAINLLFQTIENDFEPSMILLCLAIVKKISPVDLNNIKSETSKHGNISQDINQKILNVIKENNLVNQNSYNEFYLTYKELNFVYNYTYKAESFSDFTSYDFEKEKSKKKLFNQKNIDKFFYSSFLNQ